MNVGKISDEPNLSESEMNQLSVKSSDAKTCLEGATNRSSSFSLRVAKSRSDW